MHPASMRTVIVVMGMRDNACRERVAEALGHVAGVGDVNVSLIRARATIVHAAPCSRADLVRAIVNAGFGAAIDEQAGPGTGSGRVQTT